MFFYVGIYWHTKGVPISFENLTTYWRNARRIINAERHDIFSQTFDHSFDLAIHDVLLAITSFAKLVILSKDDLKDPVQSIEKYKITIWFSVPSLIPLFRLKSGDSDLHTLRLAMFCGEKFYTEHAQYLGIFVTAYTKLVWSANHYSV